MHFGASVIGKNLPQCPCPFRAKTSTEHLGRGIRKVIFICGEIKDLVSESDKHCACAEDPDDLDLNKELEGLTEEEAAEVKRE